MKGSDILVDEIRNIILAGIGSAAYSYEKAAEMVDNLVKKGQLTIEQGIALTEELRRTVKNSSENIMNKTTPITKEDMMSILKQMNLATKDDFNQLNNRINELESKINK